MLAFRGTTVPAWLRRRLDAAPLAGFSLFRADNVRSPGQVLELTRSLRAAAARDTAARRGRPILVAADQEGGQLIALGAGWTQFAGAMALGATDDVALAERVGRAIGLELRAVGVTVDYAPVMDVATEPDNPALGIRSFGDHPDTVATMGSAWLRGLQSAGVAATLKHFPGSGEVVADTHHELGLLERSREDLAARELRPFRDGIAAGARLVMSGHFAVPSLTGSASLPATLARPVMRTLLREELGFEGVSITDALDMRALPQDATQAVDVIAALRAGVDMLLSMPATAARARIESALARADAVDLLDREERAATDARLQALHAWLASFREPPLEVVGSREHATLARELAARSLTLVRDDGTLPLKLPPDARIAAIMPVPMDLTPADTSSLVGPGLAAALRAHHPGVDELLTSWPPTSQEIAAIAARVAEYDVLVIGTIAARPGSSQAELVETLRRSGRPLVSVALRTPWDLEAYPSVATHVCTYSILPESMEALAAALFGHLPAGVEAFPGRLPVAIRGVAERGHGLSGRAA